jgi:hypothetical protein
MRDESSRLCAGFGFMRQLFILVFAGALFVKASLAHGLEASCDFLQMHEHMPE